MFVIKKLINSIKTRMSKNIYSKCKKAKINIEIRKELNISNNISIISNNCLGGCICHDFSLQFNSPIINCYISWMDFPFFIDNLKEYMEYELFEKKNSDKQFPVGVLGNDKSIDINFNHSQSFNQSKIDFDRRRKRINYNKILVIIDTFGEKLSDSFLDNVKRISQKYKTICLYSKKNNPYIVNNEVFVPLEIYDQKKYFSGLLCQYKGFTGKRYYDEFNIEEILLKFSN